MLFMDHLNEEQVRQVRHILRAEDFGTNEVDIQPEGLVFLNGYFSLRELQLVLEAGHCAAREDGIRQH